MVGQNEMPTRFDLRLMLHEQEKDMENNFIYAYQFLKNALEKEIKLK